MTGDPFSPPGHNSLAAAVGWIDGLLRGELATSIAVIAVAFVGFGMMSGRISARKAGTTVLGCFILFGAPLIARGLMTAALWGESPPPSAPYDLPPLAVPPPPARAEVNPYDPYSNAAPVRPRPE